MMASAVASAFCAVDVGDDHVRARLGQGERRGLADALAGAGDQGNLIGQAHAAFPLCHGHSQALIAPAVQRVVGVRPRRRFGAALLIGDAQGC